MKPTKPAQEITKLEVKSRKELRRWLQKNHAQSRGCWVITFKKHVGKWQTTAEEVGEEALCFGWVDSKVGKVDADRSMLLITPRKPNSRWSRTNKQRIAKLEQAGLLEPAGAAMVALAKSSGTWSALDAVEDLVLPPDLKARFKLEAKVALQNFDAFPRSVKRGILEWILTAKKPQTRADRIEQTVTMAARNERANQWRP
ncbi:MAG: YdeI/OmpD-associated family protein [Deltaproteobacteria bacterium]|nr:YdeI/OmpD-associated family protein [Deltaproteobacteria bacterium]